jgi:hypothetical protein
MREKQRQNQTDRQTNRNFGFDWMLLKAIGRRELWSEDVSTGHEKRQND